MPEKTTDSYHSRDIESVLEAFECDPDQGLAASRAEALLEEHGRNELVEEKGVSVWKLFLRQFASIVVYILGGAMILAFSTGRFPEGWALLAVILVNAVIGFVSEWRARKSMAALQAMGKPHAHVIRDGEEKEIAVETVVPGDVLVLGPEDIIPADARLIEVDALRISEAALTGESVPVNKSTDPVGEDAPLAERTCCIYKGTTVQEGSGKAVVTATGMRTELGRISELASGAEQGEAPLQERLDELGAKLAYVSLGLAVLIGGLGLALGRDMVEMIETALALGVAMIPEGLPIVATIALARGMWIMAKREAIINKLTAVQTLGATQVICTDKTGTLTENEMVMRRILTPEGNAVLDTDSHTYRAGEEDADGEINDLVHHAVRLGVLCNNAELSSDDDDAHRGDPTELALLDGGVALEMAREKLLEQYPERREVDFDPDVMMMATYHERPDDGEILVSVKGAPERVLEACSTIASADGGSNELSSEEREEWLSRGDELAAQGFRLLAVADKVVSNTDPDPYEELRLVGFLALDDPPRSDVKEAIEACHSAGIDVVMVTGDRETTAHAIGKETSIVNKEEGSEDAKKGEELGEIPSEREKRDELSRTHVFARVSPEQKLNLVKLLQEDGKVVAMTGDGVNDTPALKRADIGIAMGKRGTDAAKQVADMVLRNDDFSTILAAIEQGRIIFGNIRKSVVFMLCTNLSEIIAVGIAATVGLPLPLLPLQILYLNVLTDVFPALALGVGRGSHEVLKDPPRPKNEGIMTGAEWKRTVVWGCILAACVLCGLLLSLEVLGLEEDAAITVSFLTLGFAKLTFVLNLRDVRSRVFNNEVLRNKWIWFSSAFCLALLCAAAYLPGLKDILSVVSPTLPAWGVILGLSVIPVVLGQIWLTLRRRKEGLG
ncbi:MAG: ATPase [Verrucomicrobiales bacterium]|nr:ATPase [Verrucomicrobiales bacterium]